MSRVARQAWVFTLHHYTEDEVKSLSDERADIDYIVFQRETCPSTGTPHLQGFVILHERMRMSALKKLPGFRNDVHLEAKKGTSQQAADYCKEPEKRDAGTEFFERGVLVEIHQGSHTELMRVKRKLDEGKGMLEVAQEDFPTYVRVYKALYDYKRLRMLDSVPLERPMSVFFLFGGTGTGKTTFVFRTEPSLFAVTPSSSSSGSIWFDGYNGEHTLLLDEFTGSVPLAEMNSLMHGFRTIIRTKGSSAVAAWTKVYILSNVPIEQLYRAEQATQFPVWEAFLRRVTFQLEITHANRNEMFALLLGSPYVY